MYAGGAHTSHHPQKRVIDTQNKALGLWNIIFCCGKRTRVLVAKKIAERR
jgi:hypothetical protein